MEEIVACRLGHMEYDVAWALQKRIQARLIQAKRQTPPEVLPHVLLIVEHPPVYTLGKSGDRDNLLADDATLAAIGATFRHIDRGGDITYHGPGQFVGYPLFDLDRFFHDIHRYLRELEEAIIRTCADYGLRSGRVDGRTGVWIGPDEGGDERKICAMGIRCSRWVTMHGFAFNLNTDLGYFDHIVPCGITDRGVTSLAAELGHPVDERPVQARVLHHLGNAFGATVTVLDRDDAHAFLDTYLADVPGSGIPSIQGSSVTKPN